MQSGDIKIYKRLHEGFTRSIGNADEIVDLYASPQEPPMRDGSVRATPPRPESYVEEHSTSAPPTAEEVDVELFAPPGEQADVSVATNPLARAFTGPQAKERVQAVRDALEDALDAWWSHQELLSPALLRNSLLVLEAGYALDEAFLSLILRSALKLRRGMITALRYQTDPDRAAYLLKDALLNEKEPLPTSSLWHFQREDEESEEWAELLIEDLQQELGRLRGRPLQLAQAALQQLESRTLLPEEPAVKPKGRQGLRLAPDQPILIARPQQWPVGRSVLILLFLIMLASFYLWRQQRSVLAESALIPAGQYALGSFQENAPPRIVSVGELAMDRTEVTNGAYRRCYEQGVCAKPAREGSATHADYFNNPVFEQYPVVNVDWRSAFTFCAWADKRLPSADEWEVAASVAPATARQFRYPWGNLYDDQLANSGRSHLHDALQVGLRYPVDASPFGLTDMAGNVAEWTSTPGRNGSAGETASAYLVKGGSFLDDPSALAVDVSKEIAVDAAESWLGFRCVQVHDSPGQN
ncbi:MAG: SUMF1/EgtB/PvdO family nonheme iron enzyme [Caldilineaceae bacterium]